VFLSSLLPVCDRENFDLKKPDSFERFIEEKEDRKRETTC
jgi:hypothetical protein